MTDNTADVWSSAEMFVSLSSVASCQTEHDLEVFVFPDLLWALELYKCISNVNIGNFTMHHGRWSLTVYCWILFMAVIWTEWMIKISHRCVCVWCCWGRDVCTHHIHAVWRRSVIRQLSHNVFMAHKSGHMNGRKSRLPEKQQIMTLFQNNTPACHQNNWNAFSTS